MESMISIPQKLEHIDDALRASAPEVLDLTADFVAEHPDNIDGWIFRGRALQLTSEFAAMLDAAMPRRRVAMSGSRCCCPAMQAPFTA
jgi:hypothetical protein